MAESKPSPIQSILDTIKTNNYWDRGFTITFTVRVKPGTEQSMIDQIRKIIPLTHKEEGCITFEFSQALTDSTHFVLYEHWKNGPSLEFHFGQTYTQEFGGLLAQIATSTESQIFAPIQSK
jgi:quinol monooxygenase YgiN